jgi:hypothetical protein
MAEWNDREVGTGSRVFAAFMAIAWIGVGIYGIYDGALSGPWYIAAVGLAAVIYGALWGNVARTGRFGRIPLWP